MKSLYRILFPNGKIYIGVSQNSERRWKQHRLNARRGMDLPVYRAIRKYGDAIRFEVLLIGPDEYIYEMEIKFIRAYRSMVPHGYNASPGGKTSPVEGIGHTAESRQKMSLSRKGTGGDSKHMKTIAAIAAQKRQTPEYREKARQSALCRWSKPGAKNAATLSAKQKAALEIGRTLRHPIASPA